MFALYSISSKTSPIKAYAWINPEGICFTSREIAPLGWHTSQNDEFKGMARKQLTSDYGFKKVATKMTQEQLSKGWLTY